MRLLAQSRYRRVGRRRGRCRGRPGDGDRSGVEVDDGVVAVAADDALRDHLRAARIRGRADDYGTAVADLVVAVVSEDADAGGRGLDPRVIAGTRVLVVGGGRIALRRAGRGGPGCLDRGRAAVGCEVVGAP